MMLHPLFTFTNLIRFPRYDFYPIFIFLLKRTLN
ncbi:unnamed protein product [Brassica oleracea]